LAGRGHERSIPIRIVRPVLMLLIGVGCALRVLGLLD